MWSPIIYNYSRSFSLSSTMTMHAMHINAPCGNSVILLTQVVLGLADETDDVWCTSVDPVDCWLIVILSFVNIVVMMGIDDEELDAYIISVYTV